MLLCCPNPLSWIGLCHSRDSDHSEDYELQSFTSETPERIARAMSVNEQTENIQSSYDTPMATDNIDVGPRSRTPMATENISDVTSRSGTHMTIHDPPDVGPRSGTPITTDNIDVGPRSDTPMATENIFDAEPRSGDHLDVGPRSGTPMRTDDLSGVGLRPVEEQDPTPNITVTSNPDDAQLGAPEGSFLEVQPGNIQLADSGLNSTSGSYHDAFSFVEGASRQGNESLSSEDKTSRLVEVIESGNQIHFQLNEEIGGYDVFAGPSNARIGGTEDEVVQMPQSQGCGPSIQVSSPSNSSPTGAIPFGDHKPSLEDVLAMPNRVCEVGQEGWSSDEDKPPARRQPERGPKNKYRGRRLAVIGQDNKIEIHRIAPIPFDIHKQRRLHTPSASSDNTEPESQSPSFLNSCKAAVKEAYQKFAFTSTEGPVTGGLNSAGFRPNNIEEWVDQTKASSSVEQATPTEEVAPFKIWEDFESGGPSASKSATLPRSALQDVTNFRPFKTPPFDVLVRNPAVATEAGSGIDATRVAALKGAKRLPSRNPSGETDLANLREIVLVPNPADASQFAGTQVSVQDTHLSSRRPLQSIRVAHYELSLVGGETGSSSSRSAASGAIRNAAGEEASSEQDAERDAHFAFALARLEGRVSPKASSPLQRCIDTTEMYGDDPSLLQPTPLRWISRGELLERFHAAAETGFLDESNHSTNSSLTADQNCLERPQNPTPSQGRNSAGYIDNRPT